MILAAGWRRPALLDNKMDDGNAQLVKKPIKFGIIAVYERDVRMTEVEKDRVAETLSPGVENRKYYVYMLCRSNGQPFYVGKGQYRRVFDHEEECQEVLDEIANDKELDDEEKGRKRKEIYDKLRIIGEEGEKLQRIIVKWGLSDHEAYMCESTLINALQFCGQKNVKIRELANRVNGHASRPEKECPSDIKTMARTTEVYLRDCAIREVSVDGIQQCVALIKINDFYPRCFDDDGTINMEKVKDCARGIWHIGKDMRGKIKYIFALYHCRVVGTFRVLSWSPVEAGMPDYPIYPEDVREAEKLAIRFETIEDAEAGLAAEDFAKVRGFLSRVANRKEKTEKKIFDDLKGRVCFTVDDNVPAEIVAHINTIAVGDGDPKKFKCQAPVQYNHE